MTKNHGTLALAAVAAGSLLLDGCATVSRAVPGSEADRVARFEQQAEALRTRLFIPGMSAVIVKDERVLWAKGFGYADVEHQVSATPETVYSIASETKPVAATLVMQLVEQGRLDLDEPASHYTSEITGDAIRIKHLLSHTARSDPPGERFSYDPQHYEYLTNVIEKQFGKPMRLVVAETILDPLGMTSSVPGPDVLRDPRWAAVLGQDRLARYARALERQAQPYTLYGNGEIIHVGYPGDFFGASAGLLSTVTDMAKFDIALDRHVLLRPETQARAWTPFVSNAGQPLPYGLGWFVRDYNGVRIIWHGGNWGTGFSAIYVKVPAQHLSLIMFANSDVLNGHMYAVGEDIVNNAFACAFLRDFVFAPTQDVDCARASETAVEKSLAEERAGAHAVVPVDRATVESYVGQYRFEFDPRQVITVTSRDGRLYGDIPAKDTELFPESPTTFFFKIRPAELTFVKEGDTVTHLNWVENGNTLRANRIQ
jgi:CubicO group peptidase (beta-lactamase class C family)